MTTADKAQKKFTDAVKKADDTHRPKKVVEAVVRQNDDDRMVPTLASNVARGRDR